MGFKRWLRLEEVSSDDLNEYLALQIVARFTTAAARAAAIPQPEDGQVSYLTSSGAWEAFSAEHAAWVPVPGTAIARASVSVDVGLPIGFTPIVTLPAATYYAGRTYNLDVPAVTIANVTGANRAAVLRWERVGGAQLAVVANPTIANNERVTVPAGLVWTPGATFAGELVLTGSADQAMGATGNNGVIARSAPVHAIAVDRGAAAAAGAGAQGSTLPADLVDQLPAGDDPAPAPHRGKGRRR